jgi:hypothetical protein
LAGNESRFGEEDREDPIAFPDGATETVSIGSLLNRKGSMAMLTPGPPPVSPALTTSSTSIPSQPSLFAMSTGAGSGPVTVGAGISLALPPPLLTERNSLPAAGIASPTNSIRGSTPPPIDDSPMVCLARCLVHMSY